jgi:putative DNA primase/helicase
LDDCVVLLQRFVLMSQAQAIAVTLWIMLTWFIKDVQVAALLLINAPEKACGKSQLLTLVGHLVSRPLSAANSTVSFLFRAIQRWCPTLLVDEADTFIKENDELKGLVNAGHTRANAFVGRTVAVGDGHEPRLFEVWAAKAFAGISLEKHFPDATMSRGIVINMRKKMPDEKVERLRHAPKDLFAALASKMARFAEDYSQRVRDARPALPEELSDREQDNWEPLLAIASCAGSGWIERATKAALDLSKSTEATVSTGNELLADIQTVFEQKRTFKISTVDLIEALVNDQEKAWATYNRGRQLSPRQLAKQLAAYGIQPKTVRMVHPNFLSYPKGSALGIGV